MASAEQILSKCSAGAKWLQVLSKFSASTEQILSKYWVNIHQDNQMSWANNSTSKQYSIHFKTFQAFYFFAEEIFLLRKCFCWGNFMLSKCQESLYELSCKIWSLRVKNGSYMSTLDLFLLFTKHTRVYWGVPRYTRVYQSLPECTN